MITAALHDVVKMYGGRTVIDRQSIEFPQGTITVVRGRSGSGKSTLLNLIAGYADADSGEVSRPARIGYLVQEELLFSELSVMDNMRIRLAGGPDGPPAGGAIERALTCVGVEELVETPVSRLSGGERRRVEIAAVVALAPDVVLLDEPTSGLDPQTRVKVYEAAWSAFDGGTVVLVTHEDDVPGLPADARELVLDRGVLR